MPVTTPVIESIVATDEGTQVHKPPGAVLDKVIVAPTHTVVGPEMVSMVGLTV